MFNETKTCKSFASMFLFHQETLLIRSKDADEHPHTSYLIYPFSSPTIFLHKTVHTTIQVVKETDNTSKESVSKKKKNTSKEYIISE